MCLSVILISVEYMACFVKELEITGTKMNRVPTFLSLALVLEIEGTFLYFMYVNSYIKYD